MKILLFIFLILNIMNISCTKEISKKEGTYYVFLEDYDYYILLKKNPCVLNSKEMVWFKAQLLALRIKTKVSRNWDIDTPEKLNEAYGRRIDFKNLSTCTIDKLNAPDLLQN